MSNNSELHGWDDIARFLGVSRRTAQTYESEYGLPVRRMRGTKGRVWALSAEIEAWKTLRPVQSAIAETPGKPQTETVSDTDQHGPATQTCKDAEPVSEVEIALNTAQLLPRNHKCSCLIQRRWSAGLRGCWPVC